MIQWSYVAPRLAIVACLLLFLGFALDPFARWTLVEVGQRSSGARIEIARVDSSLVYTQLALESVAIGNPHASQKNLLAAQGVYLDLDAAALSHRRLVVEQGVVQGLVINGPRADAGAVDYQYELDLSLPQLGDAGEAWLIDAAKLLGENLADDLESVQLARSLAARWPQEYAELQARTDRWLSDVQQLQKLPDVLGRDPLGDAERVQRAALTLRALKEDLLSMRTEFQRLQQQAKIDRGALTDAVERDVARIEERLNAATLDPQKLTEYLLGPEVAPRVAEAVRWAKWAREHIPSEDLPEPARARGLDISFASATDEPWFVAHSLRIDGEILLDERRLPFSAIASGLTSQPRRLGEPMVFRVKLDEPVETWIELIVDRTSSASRDKLTIICPHIPMRQQTLGDAQRLAISLSPGSIVLQTEIVLEGDAVAGQIQLRRRDLSLGLQLDESLGGASLAQRVERGLRDVREVDLHIALGGTLQKPEARLRSPLGDQLVTAIRGSIEDEISLRRAEVREKARSAIEAEISTFNDRLAVQKQLTLKKLALADDEQKQLESLIAGSLGLPKQRISRQLMRSLER